MIYQNTLKEICSWTKVTEEQIHQLFLKNEGVNVDVVKKDIGKSGFEIITNEGICFVTEYPISYYNKKYGRVTSTQERMLDLSIPIPLYIGEGDMNKEVYMINNSSDPRSKSDEWLLAEFTEELAMTYFLRYFSQSQSFVEYKTIIFEAIEAYFMGLENIAIMALLPVFEGGLRNVQYSALGMNKQNVSAKEFEKGLKKLIIKYGEVKTKEYIWHPGKSYNNDVEINFFTHISPQSDVINAFRLFFSKVLYSDSNENVSSLNRHVILHMLKNEFNNRANFPRVFYALTHITFIERLNNQDIPFLWPGYNNDLEVIAWGSYLRKISNNFKDPRRKYLDILGISNYNDGMQ